MKTCVISFSSRADGNCAAIADCVQETLGAGGLTRFDFSGLSVHGCGACHCECFRQREACPYFADDAFRLNEAAALADRTVFIVPNYCDFPCSNFFLFNERSQCCFNGHAELADRYLAVPKKFIVVSNTGRENFLAAFRDHVLPGTEPDVCFLRGGLSSHQPRRRPDDLRACPCSRPGLLAGLVMQRPERHAGRQ